MAGQLIVVGASAGGVDALLTIAKGLPADFAAPVIVVLHIGMHRSLLPQLMSTRGPNKAIQAEDGMVPTAGTIYVAPPDHHVLIDGGLMRLSRGPKEHHSRPAIDPLFRSAALDMGARVIGIVLTGMLDDGTAGLRAIKDCGGIAVVQDPADAFAPSMPASALMHVDIDHIASVGDMAALMSTLLSQDDRITSQESPPEALRREHAAHFGINDMETIKAIGSPSTFTCPDCGGTLFELFDKRPVRYLCHTGHAFSVRSLAHAQEQITDEALWTSLRTLQEKHAILKRLAEVQAAEAPGSEIAAVKEAAELEAVTAALRGLAEKAPISHSFDILPLKRNRKN